MFANAFQSGFISIFYSVGSAPLSIWNKEVKNGHIRRVVDEEVKSLVLEISGTNVATTYITCPQKPRTSLAIKLPFLVMIIKNMKKYFTFEIQILDDKDIRRRFRVSNFQSTTKVRPFCTTMPIGLSDGWNQVQFNLADFTKRAYGSTYLETVRVQIHANVRIRRIYFSDTLYSEDEMPNEFRLFLPTSVTKAKPKEVRGRISKKSVEKAKLDEEVPSGAPPSPVEEVQFAEEIVLPVTTEIAEEAAPGEEIPLDIPEEQPEIVGEEKPTGDEVVSADVEKETGTEDQKTEPTSDAQVEETNVEGTNVEGTNVEEANVEETKVEETNVEETNVGEKNVEETNVEAEAPEGEKSEAEEKPPDASNEVQPFEGEVADPAAEPATEVVEEPPPASEKVSLPPEEVPSEAPAEEVSAPPPEE